jgi:hypothetical protein
MIKIKKIKPALKIIILGQKDGEEKKTELKIKLQKSLRSVF